MILKNRFLLNTHCRGQWIEKTAFAVLTCGAGFLNPGVFWILGFLVFGFYPEKKGFRFLVFGFICLKIQNWFNLMGGVCYTPPKPPVLGSFSPQKAPKPLKARIYPYPCRFETVAASLLAMLARSARNNLLR